MSTRIDRRFFKDNKVAARADFLHPTAYKLLQNMIEWCCERGFDPVVTETVTTEAEDKALKRGSSTHREGRAFDIRSRDWKKADIDAFMAFYPSSSWGSMGAVSSSTGKPNLIVHHDAGTGMHFHVQLSKAFVAPMPTAQELPDGTDLDDKTEKIAPPEETLLSKAVSLLVENLRKDAGYRESWKANIAMQFKDEWDRAAKSGGAPSTSEQIHVIANNAAENFLKLFCYQPENGERAENERK